MPKITRCLSVWLAPTLNRSFHIIAVFLTGSLFIALAGCDEPESTGISAATSGFEVEDEDENNGPDSTSSKSEPANPLTDSPIFADSNSTDSQSQEKSNEFGEKLLSPLKLPESADQAEIRQFFLDCDKQYRLLFARFQEQLMTQTDFLTISRNLADKRLRAASRLEKIAGDDKDAQGLAIRQRLQGYSELATVGDREAIQAMELLAKESANSENSAVAHVAKVYLTEIEMGRIIEQRSEDYPTVIELYKQVLADKDELKTADFFQGQRVLQLLGGLGQTDGVNDIMQQMGVAFEDFADASIANAAWQMKLQGSEEMKKLAEALESFAPNRTPVSTGDFRQTIRNFSDKFESSKAIVFLAQQLTNVEYSGNVQHARELVGLISERVPELKGIEKSSIEELLAFFDKRTGVVGKKIKLPGIVDFGGDDFDEAALDGKVFLVDFWATWCGPCIREFPNMQRLYEEYNDDGFEIIGISIDETDAAVSQFTEDRPLPWRIARPAKETGTGFKSKIARQYGVGAIPFMILVDRKGIARYVHIRGESLGTAVKELLAETPDV